MSELGGLMLKIDIQIDILLSIAPLLFRLQYQHIVLIKSKPVKKQALTQCLGGEFKHLPRWKVCDQALTWRRGGGCDFKSSIRHYREQCASWCLLGVEAWDKGAGSTTLGSSGVKLRTFSPAILSRRGYVSKYLVRCLHTLTMAGW